jgi:hypothetical protein
MTEFIEDGKIDVGFSQFYQEKISPAAAKIEKMRRKYLTIFLTLILISIPSFFAALVFSGSARDEFLFNISGLVFLFSLGVSILVWSGFRKKIKSGLFADIFTFFDDFSFSPKGDIKNWQIEKFNILPYFERLKSEDLISGKYKNVNLEFCEILAEKTAHNQNDKSHQQSVFKGAAIIFDFHKNFKGRTLVKKDLGLAGNFYQNFHDLQRVELEDPEFEKMFQVYSTNQIEARYLLTTSFMERIKQLTNFLGGKSVEASFYEGNLLLIFSGSKNLFEAPSLFRKISLIAECKKIIAHMGLIFEIVDILKLDERVGFSYKY